MCVLSEIHCISYKIKKELLFALMFMIQILSQSRQLLKYVAHVISKCTHCCSAGQQEERNCQGCFACFVLLFITRWKVGWLFSHTCNLSLRIWLGIQNMFSDDFYAFWRKSIKKAQKKWGCLFPQYLKLQWQPICCFKEPLKIMIIVYDVRVTRK